MYNSYISLFLEFNKWYSVSCTDGEINFKKYYNIQGVLQKSFDNETFKYGWTTYASSHCWGGGGLELHIPLRTFTPTFSSLIFYYSKFAGGSIE